MLWTAKAAKSVLVTCAETRLGAPKGDKEITFGDGAAAFLVSDAPASLLNFEGSYSVFQEMHENWRSDKDTFVRSWEERFIREAGYTRFPEVYRCCHEELQHNGAGYCQSRYLRSPTPGCWDTWRERLASNPWLSFRTPCL